MLRENYNMLSDIYNNKKRTIFVIFPVSLLIGVVGLATGTSVVSSGAMLSLLPAKSEHAVGHVFSVDVALSTKDPANVAGVTITYPPDLLQVLEVSKQDSLFSLWIEEPEYKAVPGMIHFSGGVTRRQGFTGEGTLATIIFRSKKIGEARVDITDAQVLLGDGTGTDILLFTHGGVYTFTETGWVEFDLDGNGSVNMKDLGLFVEYWGGPYEVQYDFNRNKKIDLNDLTLLVLVLVRGEDL